MTPTLQSPREVLITGGRVRDMSIELPKVVAAATACCSPCTTERKTLNIGQSAANTPCVLLLSP